jgi:hypothetical protein
VQNCNIGNFFANELKHPYIIRSEDQLLSNKSSRLRLVLLFGNNWSSDLIYGRFRSLAKKFCTWDIICDYSTSGRGEYFKQTLIIIFIQGNYYFHTKLTE